MLRAAKPDTKEGVAADDDKLFDLQGSASFPDALSELGNLQDQPNDRQVGMLALTCRC